MAATPIEPPGPAGSDDELWGRVRALPDKQRLALGYRFGADLGYADLAALLDCSEAAARRSVFEGLRTLRRQLEPEERPTMTETLDGPLARALADHDDRDRATLARLHDDLAGRAAADGLVDVAYRTVDSPAGELLLAATDAGVVKVAFGAGDDVLVDLAARVSPGSWRGRPASTPS